MPAPRAERLHRLPPRRRSRAAGIAGLLATALAGAAPAGGAAAVEESLTAQVSSPTIGSDETVQLTVSLTRDVRQVYLGYTRPDFKDFDVLHQAQQESTQWTLSGGQQSVVTVEHHVYVLRPRHRGACVIGPARARLGNHELHTAPVTVHVTAPAKRPPGAPPPASPNPVNPFDPFGALGLAPATPPAPDAMRGDEEIFLEARADKTTAYLGEQVTVSWLLYSQSDVLRYRTTVEPKHDDFWSEDLYMPKGSLTWDRADVKGRPYEVALLMKRALFPLKAGKATVTAMEAEATTMQSAFAPGASLVRGTRPLVIDVLPLPAAGRPEGFAPTNVGHFELAAAVDRSELKAGDALTFKVTIRGDGNLRNVKLPPLGAIDGFRVYEPTTSERVDHAGDVVRGERVYTYLLLPERGGDLAVPSVTLHYFDPAARRYAASRTSPIAVHVTGDPKKVGQPEGGSRENLLGPRVRPLRPVHHVASRLGERLLRGPALVVALVAPPSLALLILLGDAIRVGLARDTEGRKRRRARAAARQRMRVAEQHLRAQRGSRFFTECARALYEQLEHRLGVRCEALTLDELRRLLSARGVDATLAEAVLAELERCDFARFASSASGPGEMRAALGRVRELLGGIERAHVTEAA